ncbi:MAG: DUF4136 domain-containing protein [Bacteroidaceae bacterium]|nr:DUF4136 domain-containing protein [Bacteroidaceae bacterium]
MKKCAFSVFIMVLLLGFVACEKDPDTDKLDNDYLVYTNYDKGTDFATLQTCHVIDSILIISNKEKPEYWNDKNSKAVVEEYKDNLVKYGYTIAESSEQADAVLQLSYVSNTYYFNDYSNGPWWNSYPGYWNWGGWGWYYPFSFFYSYSTGSIIAELVSTTPSAISNNKLTVVWNSYICGLLNGNSLSMSRTVNAIKQAFTQSPYLIVK